MRFNTFNGLYLHLIKLVSSEGRRSSPRGQPSKELLGVQVTLTDPSRSLCTLKARKLNYRFALVELLEYVSGSSDPERLCFYNKNLKQFINQSTGQFDGAYAPRIGRQLAYLYQLLKCDPDTRQAVLNLNSEADKHETKDVPCTVALQFLLRDGKLNLLVYMRSNDLLWGTPYDINAFCFLQRLMAHWLGVKVGEYTHFVGSLHLYVEREPQLLELLKQQEVIEDLTLEPVNFAFEEREIAFAHFWELERQVRQGLSKAQLPGAINTELATTGAILPAFLTKCLFRLAA